MEQQIREHLAAAGTSLSSEGDHALREYGRHGADFFEKGRSAGWILSKVIGRHLACYGRKPSYIETDSTLLNDFEGSLSATDRCVDADGRLTFDGVPLVPVASDAQIVVRAL